MAEYVGAIASAGLAFVFLLFIAMVGGALWIFARAFSELQVARARSIANAVSDETLEVGREALDDIGTARRGREAEVRYPSDDEIMRSTRAQTLAEQEFDLPMPEHYSTTDDNASRYSANGEADIPPDLLYERPVTP